MARNDQRWHWAPEELALASGPDAGFWIADGLRRGAFDVGGLVPPVFDAFARVFHPVYLHDGDDWTRVNWGNHRPAARHDRTRCNELADHHRHSPSRQ